MREGKNREDKPIEEALLANVNDAVQLSYMTSMLEDAQIPYRIIAKDLSDYLQIMTGFSFMGSCIYVDINDLDEAQAILNSFNTVFSAEDELNTDDENIES